MGNEENAKAAQAMSVYWDKGAQTYDARHELAPVEVWQKYLSGFIGDNKDGKILDIATGTGMIAHMLASYGYTDVTGADLSEGMMNIAREHAQRDGLNIRYIHANALELPYEDESLDTVISSRLLWTLYKPEEAIREWLRVLKKGGRIIAINQLEEQGIRSRSFDDPERYLGTEVSAEHFTFANASRQEILNTFTAAGVKELNLTHLTGCHMLSDETEDWYAFTGVKH